MCDCCIGKKEKTATLVKNKKKNKTSKEVKKR